MRRVGLDLFFRLWPVPFMFSDVAGGAGQSLRGKARLAVRVWDVAILFVKGIKPLFAKRSVAIEAGFHRFGVKPGLAKPLDPNSIKMTAMVAYYREYIKSYKPGNPCSGKKMSNPCNPCAGKR